MRYSGELAEDSAVPQVFRSRIRLSTPAFVALATVVLVLPVSGSCAADAIDDFLCYATKAASAKRTNC